MLTSDNITYDESVEVYSQEDQFTGTARFVGRGFKVTGNYLWRWGGTTFRYDI